MKTSRLSLISLAVGTAFSLHANAATITGKVTDEAGNPVANAVINIEGTKLETRTAEDGSYQLSNVDPSHVHLHVYSVDHIHGDLDAGAVPENYEANFVLKSSSIENIQVTANLLRTSVLESVTPVTVLSAETLRKKQAPTLGETLNSTAGVHGSYFGPVASSPIIRGTDGPRVKIVQNTLDVSDASRAGADHNVATDVSTATQIEILRGPATLQYGSGAIGGVVNIVDNRIPTQVPQSTTGEAEVRFESVSEERFGKFDITGGSGNIAWHFDIFDRETENYSIPGFAETEPHEEDEPGTLENSSINTRNITAGLSFVGDDGYFGFAVQSLENLYGVPGHGHGEEEEEHEDEEGHSEEEEEIVNLDVDMDRYQVAGEWFSPFEGISSVKFSGAYTDYEHVEFENGETGTTFTNETTEGRLSFSHEDFGGWHGVFGVHFSDVDFAAVGEEAFTAPNNTNSYALFVVEEKRFDDITLQFGGRIERNELEADPFEVEFEIFEEHHDDDEEEHDDEHDDDHDDEEGHDDEHEAVNFDLPEYSFTSFSASVGAKWEYQPGYSLALSLARSERAPSHQELFSAGNHIATSTYDLGLAFDIQDEELVQNNNGINEEVSTNLDLTWHKFSGDWSFSVSAFYNQVDDYIYQIDTGLVAVAAEHDHGEEEGHEEEGHEEEGHDDEHADEEAGFGIFRYLQDDADIYGVEFESQYRFNDNISLAVFGDYIRAEVDSDNLPRIPPMRLGSELSFQSQNWYGDLEVIWYDDQDDVSQFETKTEGYTLVNMSMNYVYQSDSLDWTFFTRLTNITDEEARVHTSFLKDRAPLPSRSLTLGVRATF